MHWLECATLAESEAVDSVAELFGELGEGVAIEEPVESTDDGEIVRIDPTRPVLVKTYLPMDERVAARRSRLEEAVWHLSQLRRLSPLRVRPIAEEDWAHAWKEYFHVQKVGARLVIVPSWRAYQPAQDEIPLTLDPGMAFGTGLHPTTRLCLRECEALVRPEDHVVDLGTGSGILAIASARLGARHVIGLDLDGVATEVAAENARRNGVADRVTVVQGSLPHGSVRPATADLVLANITVRALLGLHQAIGQVLRPGGAAAFSGVLATDAVRLVTALREAGWGHQRTEQEGDWVAIVASRPT